MPFKLGLVLLFFLPVIESFNHQLGLNLLLVSSLLICFKFFSTKKIIIDKINTLWAIMLFVFTISSFYSDAPARSFAELLRYAAYFLIFISIRSSSQPKKLINRFFLPMIIINSVLLSLLFVLYTLPFFKLTPPNPNWGPFYGMNLFYHSWGHNHLADILIFAIPLSIIQTEISRIKIHKICWLTISMVFLFFLVLSLGRTAIISFALSLFIFITIKKSHILGWWGLAVGIITIIFILSSFYISNFTRYPNTSFFPFNKFYKPTVREDRFVYFHKAIVGLQRRPLWGTGLDTYRLLSQSIRPYSQIWYVHNHFLQIFTETGIIGGVLFLLLIILLLYKSLQNSLRTKQRKFIHIEDGIIIALFASSIQSLLDYNWQYYSIFFLFWVGFALIYPVGKKVY